MFDHKTVLFRRDKKATQVVWASRVRLIGAFQFDFEPRALDQLARRTDPPSGGGQIAVDKNRIDRVEDVSLPRAQVQLASAGGAHLAARIEQAKQARRLQTPLRRQPRRMLQRRARDRMEKV